ncbi:helix-turn-helix transcriptional regulator [Streptomyces sp. NPDC002825]|uniref:helix-turn-helix transcriptional regulator n=1 Tax=Streptomyces sp. NPDC002825 TaxID=3154666 RepID=UPI00332EDB32
MGLTFFDDERLTRDVYATVSLSAGGEDAAMGISRLLAPIVAHDALCLRGTDPVLDTELCWFSFWHGYEPALALALLTHRIAGARARRPAGTARTVSAVAVVGGRSHDREADRILSAHGAGSELWLRLADPRGTWGELRLLRAPGGHPFGEDEARRAMRLAPPLLAALRRYGTSGPLCPAPDAPVLPAGVAIVGADHRVKAVSPQAKAWVEHVVARSEPAVTAGASDGWFRALSLAARARGDAPGPLICMPPARCGRWFTAQAEPLGEDGAGDVAIILQGATGDTVTPSFCAWYGLTPREREIVGALRDGSPVKRIARRLGVSPYTVNDHLKAVFRKTGAEGRDELVAALYR